MENPFVFECKCGKSFETYHPKAHKKCPDCKASDKRNDKIDKERGLRVCKTCKVEKPFSSYVAPGNSHCLNCADCRKPTTHVKCEHGKRKSDCKACSPASFCTHGHRFRDCKRCTCVITEEDLAAPTTTGVTCEHGKNKKSCVACTPNYLKSIAIGHIKRLREVTAGLDMYELLGGTIDDMKVVLEKQFIPEFNWGNFGSVWAIDHMYPIKEKGLTPEESLKRLNIYNLTPLDKDINLKKSNHMLFEQPYDEFLEYRESMLKSQSHYRCHSIIVDKLNEFFEAKVNKSES